MIEQEYISKRDRLFKSIANLSSDLCEIYHRFKHDSAPWENATLRFKLDLSKDVCGIYFDRLSTSRKPLLALTEWRY